MDTARTFYMKSRLTGTVGPVDRLLLLYSEAQVRLDTPVTSISKSSEWLFLHAVLGPEKAKDTEAKEAFVIIVIATHLQRGDLKFEINLLPSSLSPLPPFVEQHHSLHHAMRNYPIPRPLQCEQAKRHPRLNIHYASLSARTFSIPKSWIATGLVGDMLEGEDLSRSQILLLLSCLERMPRV
ncbi:hypothetical protein BU26DRAFT_289044 [Trematosphaeria pertusa]|uniref:Uncharacterized protein n=1 Tax=Trematosphaeria pertusa TaxID=390896 RepID=A0A6A6IHU7_9PLEO|nr:uncharacterized protein BU26DRAFT_289044 [Trematosphaeria pertusa]KAF2249747.1 hypothetical protein BU26DRAFT_289044 [Trematosphaeria pertusa]